MKEIKIQVPEGYEIDEQSSNFAEGKIIFKKKNEPWKNGHHSMSGYFISGSAEVMPLPPTYRAFSDNPEDNNVFATEQQAKSAWAMAQLSQIMQNDSRLGGPITNADWRNRNMTKYIIERIGDRICTDLWWAKWYFLAFHTAEQRDLFLRENESLIKEYFMMD
jgi:hypothetical protein